MTQDPKTAGKVAEDKRPTVTDGMDARRLFSNLADATAYLNNASDSFKDFASVQFAAPAMDSEGNFDPAVYEAPGVEIMVSTLREQKKGVKGIVVLPVPTLDALMADESGKAWVQKIIHKELNHVGVRALRVAADISTVQDQIPVNMTGYITAGQGTGGIIDSYNSLYAELNDDLGSKSTVWKKARFTKADLRSALESKAFANEYYPAIENRGEGKESLLVQALKAFVFVSKKRGLDPAIFQRWLDTRDQIALGEAEGDDEDFDAESIAEGMMQGEEQVPATATATDEDAPAENTEVAAESTEQPVEEAPAS